MREFHDQFDATAVSDRIGQPPFADLVHRGRRRSRRARGVGLTGVAVVAALAATPLLTLPGGTGVDTPAATSPPSVVQGVWRVTFLDVDHGVAYNWDQETCAYALFVTDDGGASWSEPRDLPGFPDRERIEAERYCLTPDVIPVSPETFVIPRDSRIEHEYVSMGMEPPTGSYLSHDAGRTWQEYEPEIREADAVPDGVIPDLHCETYFEPGEYASPRNNWCVDDRSQLSWYDPDSGDQLVLRNNPHAALNPPTVGSDGSIWAGGHDSDGDHHISVSSDRGRTWQDVSPPAAEEVDEATRASVAAVDRDTAYFTSVTETAASTPPPQLHRTTDGGQTWQPLPAAQEFEIMAGLWVATDGTLFVVDLPDWDADRVMYRSDDGGDTFTQVDLPAAAVWQISGGFQGIELENVHSTEVTFVVSEDGLSWREYDRPEFRLPE